LAIISSREGDEPYLLEAEFRELPDLRRLDPFFLDRSPDGFGTALCFFSPEAFRYYLPTFLLADLDGVLRQADPAVNLWHGLDDEFSGSAGERTAVRRMSSNVHGRNRF
jgi:hypothetical protein